MRLPSVRLTLLVADDDDGTGQFQASVSVSIEGSGCTLNPGARLEVDGVQRDGLGVGEEGIGVHLPHGAGHPVGAGGGADQPAVLRESVVDVLR